jgi:gas vesicle protein
MTTKSLTTKSLWIALALLGSTALVVGCEQKTPLEKAGDDLKDAAKDTGDAMKDAAHDAKNAMQDAAHDAKDAAQDLGNEIKRDTDGNPNN